MSKFNRKKWEAFTAKKNLSGEDALEAVEQDGHALRFVSDQTEKICLAAVKNDGAVLLFVKEQTEKICMAAVKNNGYALQFVKDQTEEICLAAVKQNPAALKFVEERFLDDPDEITVNGIKYRRIK